MVSFICLMMLVMFSYSSEWLTSEMVIWALLEFGSFVIVKRGFLFGFVSGGNEQVPIVWAAGVSA